MRRLAIGVAVGLLMLAATACDSGSDAASEPTSTTRASTTTTTAPPRPVATTTRWRPLDQTRGSWRAALAALRAAPGVATGVEHMLPILRAGRELPSERITARIADGQGDDKVIWIAWRGIGDDSTSGVDYTIRVTSGKDSVEVLGAASRSICARGTAGDRLACL